MKKKRKVQIALAGTWHDQLAHLADSKPDARAFVRDWNRNHRQDRACFARAVPRSTPDRSPVDEAELARIALRYQ